MAVTADRVVVELEARLGRYEANVARAETKFDRAMSGIQKSAGATEAFIARSMGAISGALAGVSVIALARAFLSISDEAKKLDATLRLATQGFGSFGQAQKDVQRIADDTRSGLSETASLYANFVRGAKELGATQAEAARATETFSKTLKISGADTNEAASATLQFGQALAAGALRGDELNSILEASPRLARLLAESMGQPIGQIKKLGEEGKLTSDKLLKALTDQKFTAGIDAEFKEIPVTFDDAMKRVSNAAMTTFSAFDRGGEFSSILADFVSDGANGFGDMEKAAEEFGITVRSEIAGMIGLFEDLKGKLDDITARFGGIVNVLKRINSFAENFTPARTINDALDFLRGTDAASSARVSTRQRLQGQANERRFRSMIGGYDVMGNPLPGTPAAGRGPPTSNPASGSKTKTPKSKLDPAAFEREEASLNDRILRLKNDESLTAEERAKIELDRVETARTAANDDVQAEKRYTQPQKDKIKALNNQVAALEAASVIYERDADLAKRDYALASDANRHTQDLLASQADIADTRRQQYEIEKRILALRQSQERADYELLLKSRNPDDVIRGRAGLATLDAKQVNERDKLARQFESPLEAYARRSGRDPGDQIEELITQELDYVQNSISGAITKRLGVKDPLLSGIIDLFIQQNIMRPLAEALASAGGGGIGGILGGIGSVLGFASGGSGTLGGRGGTDRNVLSLNGRPFANVSRGETLSVGSKTLGGRSGAQVVQPIIQVDARGAVMNDQFAQMILSQANQTASHLVGAMGTAINKGIPTRLAKYQRDGT